MPTYQYACTDCGDRSEVVQRFTDDPLTVCSACGGKLRKVFSPVGIVFKGTGFYRTDSRNGSSTVAAGASANGSDGSSGSKDSTGEGSSSSDKSKDSSGSSSSGSDSGSSKSASGSGGSGDKKAASVSASSS